MANPAKFLSLLTGKQFTVRKESASYIPGKGEYVVNLYSADSLYDNNDYIDDKDPQHFALDDYNSLQYSRCVTEGKIIGKRVFKEVR